MKNPWKYALVAMLALTMLFSFTACDDDDDDDNTEEGLSDAETVNIVATAFVDAITRVNDEDISDGDGGVYAVWGTDTDENDTSDFYIIITTGIPDDDNPDIETEYKGYVAESETGYSVTEDSTGAYEVVISAGSYVEVHLTKMMTGAGPVYVGIESTVDGVTEKLALTAYLDDELSVLGTDDSTEDTSYTPVLTVNGNNADMTEDEITALVNSLIAGVTSVIYS